MSRLRNQSADTPVGWKFVQPQISPNPIVSDSFKNLVRAVIRLRSANPGISKQYNLSTDLEAVKIEVDEAIAAKCLAAGYGDFIMEAAASLPFPQPPQWEKLLSGALVAGDNQPSTPPSWFQKLGNVGTGLRTLSDWLGDGGVPVANELAEKRAKICSDCPQNKAGDLTSFFTKPASELIRRQLQERNDMKLSTSQDEKLGVCDACGCPLRLKIFCPVKFIRDHIPTGGEANLDSRCWITKE
jgi:hypothetical protein